VAVEMESKSKEYLTEILSLKRKIQERISKYLLHIAQISGRTS
jgi:hypothetical protein